VDWTDTNAVRNVLFKNEGIRTKALLGSPGYSLPSFSKPLEIQLKTEEDAAVLKRHGIEALGGIGQGHTFIIEDGVERLSIKINLGGRDNLFVLSGKQQRLRGTFSVYGNRNVVICGEMGSPAVNVDAILSRTDDAALFIGRGTTAAQISCWLEGAGNSLHIGDDCLFSWGIWFRLSDSHAMIDLQDRSILNLPKSIVVGPHVWIGQDVIVMKGTDIGAGSIVGARSVVTKDIPRAAVAVGMPAKVVRRNASWTRSPTPTPQDIDELFLMPLIVEGR
jgi:hypothetical protein